MRAMLSILPILFATPAGAQIWDGGRAAMREMPAAPNATFDRDLSDANRSIRDGRRRGDLSRAEARTLRAESAMIERLAQQARAGGPAWSNTAALDERARAFGAQVAAARARRR